MNRAVAVVTETRFRQAVIGAARCAMLNGVVKMPSEKQITRWTVKGWDDDHVEFEDDEGKYVLYSDHIEALTAAEQAEPTPTTRSGAVKVKPLEWQSIDDGMAFRAYLPIIGSIRIEPYGVCGWWEVLWSMPGQCDKLIPDVFDTADEAKAAAQADYEQRILSAAEQAEPAPAAPSDWVPITRRQIDAAREKLTEIRGVNVARSTMLKVLQEARYAVESAEPAPAARSGAVKVKVGEIMEAAWPEFGGNHQTAEFWQDFNEGVTFALKYLAALDPADPATDAEREFNEVLKGAQEFNDALPERMRRNAKDWLRPDDEPVADAKPYLWLHPWNGSTSKYRSGIAADCPKDGPQPIPLFTRPPESRLREALEKLLAPFADDPCRLDHHGYCQAHFLELHCCVAKARAALAQEDGR